MGAPTDIADSNKLVPPGGGSIFSVSPGFMMHTDHKTASVGLCLEETSFCEVGSTASFCTLVAGWLGKEASTGILLS